MGNRGNGERGSTDFLKPTYLSGSMNNGIIDTKSELSRQLSKHGGAERAGEREKDKCMD